MAVRGGSNNSPAPPSSEGGSNSKEDSQQQCFLEQQKAPSCGVDMPPPPANLNSARVLSKHVRTLEILYSLQRENEKLRQDAQNAMHLADEAERTAMEKVESYVKDKVDREIAASVTDALMQPTSEIANLQAELASLSRTVDASREDLADAQQAHLDAMALADKREEQLSELTQVRDTLASQLVRLREEMNVAAAAQHEREQATKAGSDRLKARCDELSVLVMDTERREKSTLKRVTKLEAELQELKEALEGKDGESVALQDALCRAEQLQARLEAEEQKSSKARSSLGVARKQVAEQTESIAALRESLRGESERSERARQVHYEERARAVQLQQEIDALRSQLANQKTHHEMEIASYAAEHTRLAKKLGVAEQRLDHLRKTVEDERRGGFGKYVNVKRENSALKEELQSLRHIRVQAAAMAQAPARRHSISLDSSGSSKGQRKSLAVQEGPSATPSREKRSASLNIDMSKGHPPPVDALDDMILRDGERNTTQPSSLVVHTGDALSEKGGEGGGISSGSLRHKARKSPPVF
jgi:chromosome segregation ATPase